MAMVTTKGSAGLPKAWTGASALPCKKGGRRGIRHELNNYDYHAEPRPGYQNDQASR